MTGDRGRGSLVLLDVVGLRDIFADFKAVSFSRETHLHNHRHAHVVARAPLDLVDLCLGIAKDEEGVLDRLRLSHAQGIDLVAKLDGGA